MEISASARQGDFLEPSMDFSKQHLKARTAHLIAQSAWKTGARSLSYHYYKVKNDNYLENMHLFTILDLDVPVYISCKILKPCR